MKLPAVAVVACFAGGIATGLYFSFGRLATSLFRFVTLIVALLLVGAGLLLVRTGKLTLAAAASICTWVLVGALAASAAERQAHLSPSVEYSQQQQKP